MIETLKQLAEACGVNSNKLLVLKRQGYLDIPPKSGRGGHYLVPDGFIERVKELAKISRSDLYKMSTIKNKGTLVRGSYYKKSCSEIKQHFEQGNEFVRNLEKKQREVEKRFYYENSVQYKVSPKTMEKVNEDLKIIKERKKQMDLEKTLSYIKSLTTE